MLFTAAVGRFEEETTVKIRTAALCLSVCCAAPAIAEGDAHPASRLSEEVYEVTTVVGGSNAPVLPGFFGGDVRGDCPIEPDLQNYVGTGTTSVPGFTPSEELAAILDAPADHYPIEIVAIAVGWSSPGGGQPNSLESALKLYSAGLPNPGPAQFIAKGPVLVDGAINEFDVTGFVGNRIINSGPFMASLEILNASQSGGPAPLHDGAGCQPGQSAVKVNGSTWFDNCTLGVSGQWVIHVKYRRTECGITDCNNNGIHDPFEIAQGLAQDCNMNGIPDDCDIANGAPDINMNGVPDECEAPCVGDLNGDGDVDSGDLAELLASWGTCP